MRMGQVRKKIRQNSETSAGVDLVETRAVILARAALEHFSSHGGQVFRTIGTFHGVDGLPKGDYPPVYSWVDSSADNRCTVSFNTPLIEEVCVDIAVLMEMPPTAGVISRSVDLIVERFTKVFTDAFAEANPGSSVTWMPTNGHKRASS